MLSPVSRFAQFGLTDPARTNKVADVLIQLFESPILKVIRRLVVVKLAGNLSGQRVYKLPLESVC